MAKPKRPRDPIQLAKVIGDIATGQVIDVQENAHSKASRLGGIKGVVCGNPDEAHISTSHVGVACLVVVAAALLLA